MVLLSAGYLQAGRPRDAFPLAQKARALTRERRERGVEAYALHLMGALEADGIAPDMSRARACYQQALTLATALGMRPLQVHCHLELGRLYGRTGDPEPARAALTAAGALYRDMEMPFWISKVEAVPIGSAPRAAVTAGS